MAKSVPALVEPSVLRWVRESIGLTPVAAARSVGVPDERVEQWETGQARPTPAQLRLAATVYKRPLGGLFLSRPPTSFDTLRDFRRLPDAEAGTWSPELYGEYRRAARQARDNARPKYEGLLRLRPTTFVAVAPGVRRWVDVAYTADGRVLLAPGKPGGGDLAPGSASCSAWKRCCLCCVNGRSRSSRRWACQTLMVTVRSWTSSSRRHRSRIL